MCHYWSRYVAWSIAFLIMPALAGCRLAGPDTNAGANQPSALSAGQGVPPATPSQEQPEVLSRGPVHEAFDEPVSLQLQEGLVAPERPPPNIVEVPPADKPQGQQVMWIPGYWSWDTDRNGYIWVSACWRVPPPKMSWVPGYWSEVSGGWTWVAGFWTPAGASEIEYLPTPPVLADVEPQGTQPSPDTIWVPPCMYWAHDQYVRRTGYWLEAQANWVWVPAHYVLTPRGCIFADGYWDYSLERRGLLFAPVYFPASVYGRSGFTYSPSIVIDMDMLRLNLFAYPRYCHYYFGDYYDDAYLRVGIYPWFDSRQFHTWYDPVYEHDRWQNQRHEKRWEEHTRQEYDRCRADKELRPARTYREQESRLAKLPAPQRQAMQVAQPLAVAVASRKAPLKFEQVSPAARQQIGKQAAAVHTFREARTRWESTSASAKSAPPPEDRKATVPPPERQEAVQPGQGHVSALKPASERQASVQSPQERVGTVAPPTVHEAPLPPVVPREPVSQPPRVSQAPQPERVKIPTPPAAGKSSSSLLGIFQNGPPARPADEDRGRDVKDARTNQGSDRDTKDRQERHGH